MKKTILLFLATANLVSCKELGLKDENFTHEVVDVKRVDYFTVNNKSLAVSSVSFSIEGELSHDAKILWSDTAPDADTVFTSPTEILLPQGKVNVTSIKDYYSSKLYVKYISLNDSTSGNLKIKIKI